MKPLWEILKANDIYAIGSVVYRALGLGRLLPNSTMSYNNDQIPALPAKFTKYSDSFFRQLVAYNPEERPTTGEALVYLEVLLWGPSAATSSLGSTLDMDTWLMNRRLDLVFNTTSSEVANGNGTYSNQGREALDDYVWPLPPGIEREYCSRFLQRTTGKDITKVMERLVARNV